MRDNRWNTTAFLLLRISQLLLGVIVLGISAYFASNYYEPYPSLPSTLTHQTTKYLAEKTAISYIASIARVASAYPDVIGDSCNVRTTSGRGTEKIVTMDCTTLNAGFAILVTKLLTLLGAIIWDGIVLRHNRNGRHRDVRAVARNAMHGGDAGVGQMAAIRGAYEMLGSMVDPGSGGRGSGGNHEAQTFLSQYQLRDSPTYPTLVASPTTLHSPYVPPPPHLAAPQQVLMMQHHQHQNHQNHHHHQMHQIHQLHLAQQPQQHQHQRQSQHLQYQQNRGPSPQELDGNVPVEPPFTMML
ncbi:hypothetical protein C7212DRAFT_365750 [Tuber magnatum]|uniref:Uncharacterized protein n=1 Tax=Tuber magnatum TaxID=42249 RepID=A0A317SIQ9_9PEZI|nr:hypothetical protein C7212DRAFT_365750 [Tuber magnatum]